MGALHVHEAGSGPPVVLLHPGPGLDGSVFFPGALTLADAGFHVLALDLPGNGRSTVPPEEEWTLRGFAAAVEAFARERRLADWTLVGHSFGGYVASQHLVDFPGSAARLVISCSDVEEEPPPGVPDDPFAGESAEVAAAFEREGSVTTPEECRSVWHDQMPFFAVEVEGARAMLDDVVFSPAMHHERDWGELHALEALAATGKPVLAISGDGDPIGPLPFAQRVADTAPRGELLVVEGAGHFPFAEAPERYWPALADWLRRTGTAG
jgi:2-hydroxy-6-oxonona-2,4-dienedioate hydrolase